MSAERIISGFLRRNHGKVLTYKNVDGDIRKMLSDYGKERENKGIEIGKVKQKKIDLLTYQRKLRNEKRKFKEDSKKVIQRAAESIIKARKKTTLIRNNAKKAKEMANNRKWIYYRKGRRNTTTIALNILKKYLEENAENKELCCIVKEIKEEMVSKL